MTSRTRPPLRLFLASILLAASLGACGSKGDARAGSTPGIGRGPKPPSTSPFVLSGPSNKSPSTTNPAFDSDFEASTSTTSSTTTSSTTTSTSTTTTTAPPPTTLPGGAAPVGTDDAVCRAVNALLSRAISAGRRLERGTSVGTVAGQVAAALRDASTALDRIAATPLGKAPQIMARRIRSAADRVASADDAGLLQLQLVQIFRPDGGGDDGAIQALTDHLNQTCPEQLEVFR